MARPRKYKPVKHINDPGAPLITRILRAIDRNALKSFKTLLPQWLESSYRADWKTLILGEITRAHGLESLGGKELGKVVFDAARERKEKIAPKEASELMQVAIDRGTLRLLPVLHQMGGRLELLDAGSQASAKKNLAVLVGRGHWPDIELIQPTLFENEEYVKAMAPYFFGEPPSQNLHNKNHHAMRHFHLENMQKVAWHPNTADILGEAFAQVSKNLGRLFHLRDHYETKDCLDTLINNGLLDPLQAQGAVKDLVDPNQIAKAQAEKEHGILSGQTPDRAQPNGRPRRRI